MVLVSDRMVQEQNVKVTRNRRNRRMGGNNNSFSEGDFSSFLKRDSNDVPLNRRRSDNMNNRRTQGNRNRAAAKDRGIMARIQKPGQNKKGNKSLQDRLSKTIKSSNNNNNNNNNSRKQAKEPLDEKAQKYFQHDDRTAGSEVASSSFDKPRINRNKNASNGSEEVLKRVMKIKQRGGSAAGGDSWGHDGYFETQRKGRGRAMAMDDNDMDMDSSPNLFSRISRR